MVAWPVLIRLFDAGTPENGGLIQTFEAGTTTNKTVYTEPTLTTAATNPVVCDAQGVALFWVDSAETYKFVFRDAADSKNLLPTIDNFTPSAPLVLAQASSTRPYDINISLQDGVTNDEVLYFSVAPTVFEFPANFADSNAYAGTAPSGGSVIFSIQQDEVEVGTVTFADGAQTGTFSTQAAISISADERLRIVAPSDTRSIQDVIISLHGQFEG